MNIIDSSVPKGLSLALFKGTRKGTAGLYNIVGRFIDRGPYSHSEIVFTDRLSGSSSFEDKGVRIKKIGYSSVGNWDFLPIPDEKGYIEENALKWYFDHLGHKYDIMGNIRFATNFARDSKDKWFCSESNLAALGFPEPFRYGPSGAASLLEHVYGSKIVIVEDTYPH
jgi:hypothetical protein